MVWETKSLFSFSFNVVIMFNFVVLIIIIIVGSRATCMLAGAGGLFIPAYYSVLFRLVRETVQLLAESDSRVLVFIG